MADNVAITAGAGTTIGTDDVAGVQIQRVKTTWGPDGTANDADVATGKPLPVQLRTSTGVEWIKAEDAASADGDFGAVILGVRQDTVAASSGTDGDFEPFKITGGMLQTLGFGKQVTVSTDVTRPANTTTYAAEDVWSDHTSSPTSGGFTFTGAARISGGSGVILDAVVAVSTKPTLAMQGEIWLFDSAVTNVNDNGAFTITDGEAKTMVGIIPFVTNQSGALNYLAHVQGLNIGFTCVGSANLRYLIKVKNAYVPGSADVLTVRLKILQTD